MAVGKSYDEVAEELAKAMNTHVSNAGRLIHTEMSNIQNRANFEGIKKAGFEGYKIVATLDARTSSICRGKNGRSELVIVEQPCQSQVHRWKNLNGLI